MEGREGERGEERERVGKREEVRNEEGRGWCVPEVSLYMSI
jgi:hypothetical protein